MKIVVLLVGLSVPVVQETRPTQETQPKARSLQREGSKPKAPLTQEELQKVRVSVDRALRFLAKKQQEEPDGSFPRHDAQKFAPIGTTALCTLAYLGNGDAGRGPFAEPAARAIDYLLSKAEAQDTKSIGYIHAQHDPHSQMHGHGYASLALAEAAGMYEILRGKVAGAKLRHVLESAVRRIESSQGESGGWYYSPTRVIEHEGSVTITLVQALRAARNIGIRVDKSVIDRAVEYVRKLQKHDGSFRYQLGMEESTPALTAAAISTLNATGEYDGPAIEQGIDYLLRKFQEKDTLVRRPAPEAFPEYSRLYTAQALYQYKDRSLWQEWIYKTQEELLSSQREDGSWGNSEFGSIYVTAMNCLVLEVCFDYLPIFQR